MSNIEDILYSPVVQIEIWRKVCREIVAYIEQKGPILKPMKDIYPISRPRPTGELLLEQLQEGFHLYGQKDFFFVIMCSYSKIMETFRIDGRLVFGLYENG